MDIQTWPREAQLAYVAAMIDAEGNIGIGLRRSRCGRSPCHEGYVVFTNTSKAALDALDSLFPSIRQNPQRTIGKPIFRLRWTNNRMLALIRAILPYLIIKREQAQLVLELAETRTPNKGRPKYWRVDSELLQRRDVLRERILTLNGRFSESSALASSPSEY